MAAYFRAGAVVVKERTTGAFAVDKALMFKTDAICGGWGEADGE
jgi:hypothetical protein